MKDWKFFFKVLVLFGLLTWLGVAEIRQNTAVRCYVAGGGKIFELSDPALAAYCLFGSTAGLPKDFEKIIRLGADRIIFSVHSSLREE